MFRTVLEACHTPLHLIPAAFGHGAADSRCEIGPSLLRERGAEEDLSRSGRSTGWDPVLPSDLYLRGADLQEITRQFYRPLAKRVQTRVMEQAQFCVIGGDHSCAIGTWSGAASALRQGSPGGELGLIWIDAHMDAHTCDSSHTNALHGMPVAALLGHGHSPLCEVLDNVPKLLPQNLCLIGVRSYEPAEAKLLRQLGVKVYYMDDIHRQGLAAVFSEAVHIVSRQTAGFGISIDLDAVDPVDAPGVGMPVPDGILGYQLLQVLTRVRCNRQFIGAEIAELNPRRDRNNKTVDLCKDILGSLFTSG